METPEPILSVGAEVDAAAIVAEIKAEVQRKLAAGVYPPELLGELGVTSDPLGAAVDGLRESALTLALEPPIRSHRPVVGPAIVSVKRAVQVAMRWYTAWLAARLGEFAQQVTGTASLLVDAITRIDSDTARDRARTQQELLELRHRVEALEQRLRESGPGG
jgi:hypothetical protein